MKQGAIVTVATSPAGAAPPTGLAFET